MRLWSLHPKYLDMKGLLAVWREGLLAQKVLMGKTKGYINHPQLQRFKESKDPLETISSYLHVICDEAAIRGYTFQRSKLVLPYSTASLVVHSEQLAYEWKHLQNKLKKRDLERYHKYRDVPNPEQHPLFVVIPGEIETWEKVVVDL